MYVTGGIMQFPNPSTMRLIMSQAGPLETVDVSDAFVQGNYLLMLVGTQMS